VLVSVISILCLCTVTRGADCNKQGRLVDIFKDGLPVFCPQVPAGSSLIISVANANETVSVEFDVRSENRGTPVTTNVTLEIPPGSIKVPLNSTSNDSNFVNYRVALITGPPDLIVDLSWKTKVQGPNGLCGHTQCSCGVGGPIDDCFCFTGCGGGGVGNVLFFAVPGAVVILGVLLLCYFRYRNRNRFIRVQVLEPIPAPVDADKTEVPVLITGPTGEPSLAFLVKANEGSKTDAQKEQDSNERDTRRDVGVVGAEVMSDSRDRSGERVILLQPYIHMTTFFVAELPEDIDGHSFPWLSADAISSVTIPARRASYVAGSVRRGQAYLQSAEGGSLRGGRRLVSGEYAVVEGGSVRRGGGGRTSMEGVSVRGGNNIVAFRENSLDLNRGGRTYSEFEGLVQQPGGSIRHVTIDVLNDESTGRDREEVVLVVVGGGGGASRPSVEASTMTVETMADLHPPGTVSRSEEEGVNSPRRMTSVWHASTPSTGSSYPPGAMIDDDGINEESPERTSVPRQSQSEVIPLGIILDSDASIARPRTSNNQNSPNGIPHESISSERAPSVMRSSWVGP